MVKNHWRSLGVRVRLAERGSRDGGQLSLRVRKLARELGRDPGYVLGVLHHLGFSRFRSIQDMLPDRVVNQVRAAVAEGLEVRTVPQRPAAQPVAQSARDERPSSDLMSSLVPGVVPLTRAAAVGLASAVEAPEEEVFVPLEPAAPEPADDERLAGRWEELLERERAVQKAEEDLAFSVAAHETAVRAAKERQVTLQPEPAKSPEAGGDAEDTQRLIDLLAIRGIRDAAEQSCAIKSFAEHPTLLKHLLQAQVSASSKLPGLIGSHVILTDGTPPDGLRGYAGVTVATERAEWPGEEQLGRSLSQLSSGFLLRGFRRVVFVELGDLEAVVLRHRLDARIEWTMSSVDSVSGTDVSLDAGGTPDAVVVWGAHPVGDLASRCADRGIWYVALEPEGVLARILNALF